MGSVEIGRRLAHYEVIAKIGEGGMGEVYRARDTKLGRDIALKVLPTELATDPSLRARFEREAKAVAALNHPNIITLHSIEEAEGTRFLTMEFVAGTTLSAEIVEGGMPIDRLLDVAVDLAGALASAHDRGIVHRDLKPANIMRDSDGRIKVLDFGLARIRQAPVSESSQSMTEERSQAGVVVGTMPYMSPEQLTGRNLDHRTDIFALGVILFEMATGRRPFRGDSAAELIGSILRDDPSLALDQSPGVPAALRGVIKRCLAKNPDDRYASCGEIRRALELVRTETSGAAVMSLPVETSSPVGSNVESGVPVRSSRRRNIGVALALVLVVAGSVTTYRILRRSKAVPRSSAPFAPIRSLAVLPFSNLSGDPAQDYFSDGFTDELTTTLSRVSALKVIARTSTARYKESSESPSEIGRALGVEGLVTGSVLRAEGRVRITVQLVSAADNSNLWAESYERSAGDVLALQAEVARAIASAISVRLSATERASLAGPAAVDPRAVDAYLRGRMLWNQRTEGAVREALQQFQTATRLAPAFGLGYAGIADSNIILAVYGFDSPRDGFEAGRVAAMHAITLDPSIGEPHASLGDIHFHYDWNWEESLRELDLAIERTPGQATAHHWRSEPLLLLGRTQEALESVRRARTLDPLSMTIRLMLARTMAVSGDRAGAMRELNDAIALDPRFPYTRLELARELLAAGRGEEAVLEARRVVADDANHVPGIAMLGLTLAATGKHEDARALLRALDERAAQRFVSGLDRARIAAGLRDRETTLRDLEFAARSREGNMPFLQQYEEFVFVHDDPRYIAIVHEVGLDRVTSAGGTEK